MTAKSSSMHPKSGILLAAFGSTGSQAEAAYRLVTAKTEAAFPGVPVRWASTSSRIRKNIARTGQCMESVESALAHMMDDDFTHITVQPLHIIPGKEHHDLVLKCRLLDQLTGRLRQIGIGRPLMGTEPDIRQVSSVLPDIIPHGRKSGEAVIFIGHGTPHPAQAFYTALMFHLQNNDPLVFVGTLSGWPDITEIQIRLMERKISTAYLIPCLAVAGNHAQKDMDGTGENSWKSALETQGIVCLPVLKGLAESPAMVDIWVEHLKEAVGNPRPEDCRQQGET